MMAGWRKSARSNSQGACVEVAAWRKPARCQTGECVEVGGGPQVVAVRDSKVPGGPILWFTPARWQAFTGSIQAVMR